MVDCFFLKNEELVVVEIVELKVDSPLQGELNIIGWLEISFFLKKKKR